MAAHFGQASTAKNRSIRRTSTRSSHIRRMLTSVGTGRPAGCCSTPEQPQMCNLTSMSSSKATASGHEPWISTCRGSIFADSWRKSRAGSVRVPVTAVSPPHIGRPCCCRIVRAMPAQIDVTFDFRNDTPTRKDADLYSPTLREYHRTLWSKQLPSGSTFTLTKSENVYLLHESSLGLYPLCSDAITTRMKGRASKVLKDIPAESLPPDLGYTIGNSIIF